MKIYLCCFIVLSLSFHIQCAEKSIEKKSLINDELRNSIQKGLDSIPEKDLPLKYKIRNADK